MRPAWPARPVPSNRKATPSCLRCRYFQKAGSRAPAHSTRINPSRSCRRPRSNVGRTRGSADKADQCEHVSGAAGEGCDEGVDLLLIRTLATGVDARTGGVTDPQYNLVRPRRVVDQNRSRVEGIEIPTLVEGPIYQIDGRARRTHLGVARNDNATPFDSPAHRHAEVGVA